MHYGCYKLCPTVRKQLRKTGESGKDIDVSPYQRNEAGPSRAPEFNYPLDKRRSKNDTEYSSSERSSKNVREKRKETSHKRLQSREETRRQYARYDEYNRSLQKDERDGRTDGRSQRSSEKHSRLQATSRKAGERQYSGEVASPTTIRKPYRTSREALTKSPGTKSKSVLHEKNHGNRGGQKEKPEIVQRIKKPKESSPRREKKDYKAARSSKTRRERKRDKSIESSSTEISDERSLYERLDNCSNSCRGNDQKLPKMKNSEKQETFDEYIINRAKPYFEDLCNCRYACLIDQLLKDSFITSTIVSAVIFAIGVKLTSEMDGWRITF